MVKKNLLNVKKACHRNRVIVTDEDGHTDFSLSLFTLHLTAYSLVKLIVGFHHWHIGTFHFQLCSVHSVVRSIHGLLSVCVSLSWCAVKFLLRVVNNLDVKLCPLYFCSCFLPLSTLWVCDVGGWWSGVLEQVVHLRVWQGTSAIIWDCNTLLFFRSVSVLLHAGAK